MRGLSATTPEPVREFARLAGPPAVVRRLGSARSRVHVVLFAPPQQPWQQAPHPLGRPVACIPRFPRRAIARGRISVRRLVTPAVDSAPWCGTYQEWHLRPFSVPECRRWLRISALWRAVVPHSAIGRQRSRLHVGNCSRP
jgi:hypothetical protein